jgi:hypothetical protein
VTERQGGGAHRRQARQPAEEFKLSGWIDREPVRTCRGANWLPGLGSNQRPFD